MRRSWTGRFCIHFGNVEAFDCKLLGDFRPNAIGTGYQSPGTVVVKVTLYGRGSGVEGDERNENGKEEKEEEEEEEKGDTW